MPDIVDCVTTSVTVYARCPVAAIDTPLGTADDHASAPPPAPPAVTPVVTSAVNPVVFPVVTPAVTPVGVAVPAPLVSLITTKVAMTPITTALLIIPIAERTKDVVLSLVAPLTSPASADLWPTTVKDHTEFNIASASDNYLHIIRKQLDLMTKSSIIQRNHSCQKADS